MGYSGLIMLNETLSGASTLPLPPAGYDLFLPATTDLSAYTQASDGTGAPVADGPVGRWIDQSGNGYHANQATSTAKPTLKTNILNGYPALRFDGGDYLDCGDVLDLGTGSMILSVVAKKTSGVSGIYAGKSLENVGVGRYVVGYTTSTMNAVYQNAAGTQLASVARAGGSYEYITQVLNRAGTNTLYADGSQIAQDTFTDDSGENHNTTWRFLVGAISGAAGTGQSVHLTGDIVEVIRYPNATPATLTALHAYNATKFGL